MRLISKFLILITVLSCNNDPELSEAFILDGSFNDYLGDKIVLVYTDCSNQLVKDTTSVVDKKFIISGCVDGAVKANLLLLQNDSEIKEDTEYISLFLEPNKIEIIFKDSILDSFLVRGSQTQIEFEVLAEQTKYHYQEIERLRKKQENFLEEFEKEGDSVELIGMIDEINVSWERTLNKMMELRLQFASTNSNSYLSSYWVNYYAPQLSQDSLKFYHQNFTPSVRNGYYGRLIQKLVNYHVKASDIGEKVPDIPFGELIGNGKSFEGYSGRYTLLDFWASNCVPCIKEIPELKKMHSKFGDKGLTVLGLSSDIKENKWREIVKNEGMNDWANFLLGNHRRAVYTDLNVEGIPTYVLIDDEGIIIGRYDGFDKKHFEKLSAKISDLFTNKKSFFHDDVGNMHKH